MRTIALGALLGVCACDPGTNVTLNEREFELPSMQIAGGGCTTYTLLSWDAGHISGESGCGPGAPGACLSVAQHDDGDAVVVDIWDQGQLLAHRRYDIPFFRSGHLDEFSLTAASGKAELFRFWGGFDEHGKPVCTPLDEPTPSVPAVKH
jgi:hypothetical protein